MSDAFGHAPRGGWAPLVSELHVEDLERSLAFWCGVLGFTIAYRRPAERFVYLERPEGGQIMLCQRNGRWETGPLEPPFGRGAMFQIYVSDLGAIEARIATQGWPIHTGPREVWRRTGDTESGQREIFVQDPDGYLLMIAANIGTRIPAA